MAVYDMCRVCFMLVFISALVIRLIMALNEKDEEKRASFVFYPIYAPIALIMWLGLSFAVKATSIEQITVYLFNVMISFGLYFIGVMAVTNNKLKKINPMTLSLLWVLPNLNYLFAGIAWHISVKSVLKLPEVLIEHLDVVFLMWLAGFISVMLWKLIEHFAFRNLLLKDSKPVKDEHVLAIWRKEKEKYSVKISDCALMKTNHLSTALTIGLFPDTSKVFLPEKNYTDCQLTMIFRHELIHVKRADSLTKLFVWFCIALNWYNPLMYAAMRKCSSHLEMCCDELAVFQENEDVRKEYAELILNESSDERGFTTCLSASAKALKRRLANVVNYQSKSDGIFALIVFSLIVVLLNPGIALASASDTGDLLFVNAGIREEDLVRVRISAVKHNASSTALEKKETLIEFLNQLELIEVKSSCEDAHSGSNVEIIYRDSSGNQKAIQFADINQGMLVIWEERLYFCEQESSESISQIYLEE